MDERPEKVTVTITQRSQAEFVLLTAEQYNVLISAIKWIVSKTDTLVVRAEQFQQDSPTGNGIPSTDEREMPETNGHPDVLGSDDGSGNSSDSIHFKGCRIRLSEIGEWQRMALDDVLEVTCVDPTAFDIKRLPKKAQRIVRAAHRFVMPMRGENWTYLARYRFDELQGAVREAYGIKEAGRKFETFLISEGVVDAGTKFSNGT